MFLNILVDLCAKVVLLSETRILKFLRLKAVDAPSCNLLFGPFIWVGLGWVGLGWVGLGWVGLGWVGLGWVGLDYLFGLALSD